MGVLLQLALQRCPLSPQLLRSILSLRYIAIQKESLLSLDGASFLLDCHMDLSSLSQWPDERHQDQASKKDDDH
jgi:hypothetical protein